MACAQARTVVCAQGCGHPPPDGALSHGHKALRSKAPRSPAGCPAAQVYSAAEVNAFWRVTRLDMYGAGPKGVAMRLGFGKSKYPLTPGVSDKGGGVLGGGSGACARSLLFFYCGSSLSRRCWSMRAGDLLTWHREGRTHADRDACLPHLRGHAASTARHILVRPFHPLQAAYIVKDDFVEGEMTMVLTVRRVWAQAEAGRG